MLIRPYARIGLVSNLVFRSFVLVSDFEFSASDFRRKGIRHEEAGGKAKGSR